MNEYNYFGVHNFGNDVVAAPSVIVINLELLVEFSFHEIKWGGEVSVFNRFASPNLIYAIIKGMIKFNRSHLGGE